MNQNLILKDIKDTSNLSLKVHLDVLDTEINNKNTQFRKLRQSLFNLNTEMDRIEKGDNLTKTLNDNTMQHNIQKLERDLHENQKDINDVMKVQQQQLNELSLDNLQLNQFLDNLEQRLKQCQDRIGLFNQNLFKFNLIL